MRWFGVFLWWGGVQGGVVTEDRGTKKFRGHQRSLFNKAPPETGRERKGAKYLKTNASRSYGLAGGKMWNRIAKGVRKGER